MELDWVVEDPWVVELDWVVDTVLWVGDTLLWEGEEVWTFWVTLTEGELV